MSWSKKRSRTWLIVVGAAAGAIVLFARADEPDMTMSNVHNDLELLRVELPDGQRWLLGEGAIGRPFLARVLLRNRGATPLRIWEPQSSEGSQCISVQLTDQKGGNTVLRMPAIERSAGVPIVLSIGPDGVAKIDNELLRADFKAVPPPGKYTLTVTYENSLDSSGPVAEVWTGRIACPPQQIEIIDPFAARKP